MILHINEYTDRELSESDCLVLICVDEKRKLYRLDIEDARLTPRFYILEEDKKFLEQARAVMKERIVRWEDCPVADRFGRKIITVYTKKKRDVPKAREFFPSHYQAAIEWHKMAMIELGLSEWIDVDLSQYKYGFIPIGAIKPAKDPGWDWQDRCCWLDSEWDARDLDHVPRWSEAPYSKCFLISCYDEAENKGALFSLRDHSNKEDVWLPSRMGERVGLDPNIKVERFRCKTETELFEKWIAWFSTRKFTSISGHNVGGGWIVTQKGREWRNGFDLPLLHERCQHLGVNDSALSPLGKVYPRIDKESGDYELIIKGILIFDWLYGWKFSRYWEDQHKTEETEDGEEVDVKLKGNGLDALGEFFFNEGKARSMEDLHIFYPGQPEFDIEKWQVWSIHESFPDLSEFYCWIDTMLSCSLDRLHNVKHDITSVAYLCGAPPEDAMLATRYHKVLTYRRLKDRIVLETNILDMGGGAREGALVIAGKKGLYKWIISIDVASMYPSIYLTMNAGIDTLIEPEALVFDKGILKLRNKGGKLYRIDDLIFAPSGAIFYKRQESVDRAIFREFGTDRKALKKLRDGCSHGTFIWKKYEGGQKRIKVCMNSRFGIAPLPIFNTATMTGKYILGEVIRFLGDIVCNGDTDGVQVEVEASNLDEALVKGKEIVSRINVFIAELIKDFGCEENFIKMEVKAVADRLLVHMKKMYMMRKVWEEGKILDPPEYEFKGFKLKRSDSSQAMDDLFKKSVDVILDSPDLDAAKINFSVFLRKWHRDFKNQPPIYFSISKALSRYIQDYKNTFESRAALFTKTFFGKEYLPGETFNILSVVDVPTEINGKPVLKKYITPNAVIAFDRLTTHFIDGLEIDYKEMERKTISCIKPFLELLEIQYDRVVSMIGGGLFK